MPTSETPNLIERLQEANAMCDDLRCVVAGIVTDPADYGRLEAELSNIEGVIGELLTMVDGR